MSQHNFEAPNGLALLAGFDRIEGEFFFFVFDYQRDDDRPVHSSMNDSSVNAQDIQSIKQRVAELVPAVPEPMWESIRQDAIGNVGNRSVNWNLDGTIKCDTAAVAGVWS